MVNQDKSDEPRDENSMRVLKDGTRWAREFVMDEDHLDWPRTLGVFNDDIIWVITKDYMEDITADYSDEEMVGETLCKSGDYVAYTARRVQDEMGKPDTPFGRPATAQEFRNTVRAIVKMLNDEEIANPELFLKQREKEIKAWLKEGAQKPKKDTNMEDVLVLRTDFKVLRTDEHLTEMNEFKAELTDEQWERTKRFLQWHYDQYDRTDFDADEFWTGLMANGELDKFLKVIKVFPRDKWDEDHDFDLDPDNFAAICNSCYEQKEEEKEGEEEEVVEEFGLTCKVKRPSKCATPSGQSSRTKCGASSRRWATSRSSQPCGSGCTSPSRSPGRCSATRRSPRRRRRRRRRRSPWSPSAWRTLRRRCARRRSACSAT